MQNTITVQLEFDYKGEHKSYLHVVKLPAHIGNFKSLINVLPLRIAKANNVDVYSYMFEVMECTEIYVVKASGFVERFLSEDKLPIEEFWQACQEITPVMLFEDIIENDFTDITDYKKIIKSFEKVYQIGFSAGRA